MRWGQIHPIFNKDPQNAKDEDEVWRQKAFQLHSDRSCQGRRRRQAHRLINHNAKYIRTNRGTKILSKGDEGLVKWYMPYNR